MISEAVRKIYILAEDNVWDDGGENVTMGSDLKLQYGVCGGEINCNTGEITPCEGVDYRDMKTVQAALQSEIELRKTHLQNSIGAFARKMNNLDPEMKITIGEFEPFQYRAEVALVMPLPTMRKTNYEMGYSYNDFSSASEKTKEWIKSQGFGNVTQQLYNFKKVPGCPDERYKVGEVDATGYTCHVSFSKGGFRLGGYRFVGVVQPYTNADQEDTDALYSDVKLTEEFSDNLSMLNYLKKISAKIKCDGCGKKTSRSFYYIFMDKSDKLYFYGRNCATKIFGIDVVEKLGNYMAGLNKLGEDFARPFEGDNLSVNEIRYIISVMMMTGVLDKKAKISYKDVQHTASRIGSDKECDAAKYYRNNIFDITERLNDFLKHGNEFFRNLGDAGMSDFTEKIKAAGINLTSGDEKAFGAHALSNWAVPYALQMYFAAKASGVRMEAEKESFGDIQQYPPFSGYKTFNCKICNIEEKKSKNGTPYLAVQAVTEENGTRYGIMWFLWRMESDIHVGQEVAVSGLYSNYTSRSSMFATLDKVQIREASAENDETQKKDISVGERLKGETVTVKKVFDKSIVVTTSGGFDFLIYTKDFNTGAPKFPINFEEGMALKVDGTMQISGNGKPYLNRCKIMA